MIARGLTLTRKKKTYPTAYLWIGERLGGNRDNQIIDKNEPGFILKGKQYDTFILPSPIQTAIIRWPVAPYPDLRSPHRSPGPGPQRLAGSRSGLNSARAGPNDRSGS